MPLSARTSCSFPLSVPGGILRRPACRGPPGQCGPQRGPRRVRGADRVGPYEEAKSTWPASSSSSAKATNVRSRSPGGFRRPRTASSRCGPCWTSVGWRCSTCQATGRRRGTSTAWLHGARSASPSSATWSLAPHGSRRGEQPPHDSHVDPRRPRRRGEREEVAHRSGVIAEAAAERVRRRQRARGRCNRSVAAGAGERPDGQQRGRSDPALLQPAAGASKRLRAVDSRLEDHRGRV
jgi:hypothetical protein